MARRRRHNDELARILALPRRDIFDQGATLAADFHRTMAKAPTARSPFPTQGALLAEAMFQAARPEPVGIIANAGTGSGKTLVELLLAVIFKAERPVLFGPADLMKRRKGGRVSKTEEDHADWVGEYPIPPLAVYRAGVAPPLPPGGLLAMSYSALSNQKGTAFLSNYEPDLLILDECQKLAEPRSARTGRVARYLKKHPNTRVCALSGTLTSKSIKDYAHLMRWCLRGGSCLPLDHDELDKWAGVLDIGKTAKGSDWAIMYRLLEWAGVSGTSLIDIWSAYNQRLGSTPGVVLTRAPSCDAELNIVGINDTAIDVPGSIPAALEELKGTGKLPNGDVMPDALSMYRARHQLSLGFYYHFVWPDDKPDHEWLNARKLWNSEVRSYLLRYATEGRDSPMLLMRHVREGAPGDAGVTENLRLALDQWDGQRHKPEPPTKAVWLPGGVELLEQALATAADLGPCLFWVRDRAVMEMCEALGYPVWSGAPPSSPDPGGVDVVSLASLQAGHNLQAWDNHYYFGCPSSATAFEQSISRIHRSGRHEPVGMAVLQHTEWLVKAWETAYSRAMFVGMTTGQKQRIEVANKHGISIPKDFLGDDSAAEYDYYDE